MLQVKKNCPALYEEVMELFNGLSEEQENDKKGFLDKYGDHYSEIETSEKNRERYEFRKCQSYSDPDGIKGLQEEPPHVASVGRMFQVRIMQVQDEFGNDITPCLTDFWRKGAGNSKSQKPGMNWGMTYNGQALCQADR